MLERPNGIDPERLAEDLLLAVATNELTRNMATLAMATLLPDCDVDRAHRLLEAFRTQANSWERLPNGDERPEWGLARRIWERTSGADKGKPVLPELVERYGRPHMFRTLANRR
ncbi:hypothetical protein ACWDRB_47230 [Nonomuraea sp. NPDC003707]